MNIHTTKIKWMTYIIGCTAVLSIVSCGKFLEEDPRDQIDEEYAYTNADALFRNTVSTLYNYIGGCKEGEGLQGTSRSVWDLQTLGSDEMMIPTRGGDWYDAGLWQSLYTHKWNAGFKIGKNSWLYLYKVITLCNRSLEVLDNHKQMLDEEQYNAYTAEVKALRAIYYWYLLDLFGRVPIVVSNDVSMNEVTQSERSEVFKFVYEELKNATAYLSPMNSVQQGDYYGRVTLSVAYFVLAKLTLNAEIYTDDDWTDGIHPDGSSIMFNIENEELNAWEATIKYCDYIADFGLQIEEQYITNFQVYNETSKENIWTIPMDKNLYTNQQEQLIRSMHYRHASAFGFSGQNGTCATKHTLESFGYGTENMDYRFDLTFYADEIYDLKGELILDRTGNPLKYYPWEVEMDLSDSKYLEMGGARIRKYEIDKNAPMDGKLMDNDIVLFRYADVLLMKAEAKIRNGQDGTQEMNAVRMRSANPVEKATLENIYQERLLELCLEGWRRQDMIRFRQYKSLYNGSDAIDESDGHTIVFPIPQDVITTNPKILQNKGY